MRPFFCILLLAVASFPRIVPADPVEGVAGARKQMNIALRQAVQQIVQKGERQPDVIRPLALQQSAVQVRKFMGLFITEETQRGVSRSVAERSAQQEVDEAVETAIRMMLEAPSDRKLPPK